MMKENVIYTGDRTRTIQIGDRACFREGDLYGRGQCNAGVVPTDSGIVLIDYPPQTPAEEMIGEAERCFKKTVTHILFTHPHGDHIKGLGTLGRKDIVLVGSEYNLKVIGAEYPEGGWKRQTVRPGDSLVIGGVTFSFWSPPKLPAHSPGDTVVFLPEEGVAFTGDFLVPPFYQYCHECDVYNWIAGVEAFAAQVPADIALTGHGEAAEKHEAANLFLTHTKKLAALFEEAKAAGLTAAEAMASEGALGDGLRALAGKETEEVVLRQLSQLLAGAEK